MHDGHPATPAPGCPGRGLPYHGPARRTPATRWVLRWATAALAVIASLSGTRTAWAQPDPDRQVWVQVLALGELGEQWRTHVEVQPRFMDSASELGLTLVRAALGHSAGRRMTVWAGYAWVPRTLGPGVRHEQRAWEQLIVTPPAAGLWTSSLRFRLEQRWLEPWTGASHRLRMLGRAQRPIQAGRKWSLYAYDELMLTLDDTTQGPTSGFDRNRLSSGLSRRLSPTASTDVGYLWEHAVGADGRRDDHVF
ncbi:MAG: DUF2490 domain-containing protein, partial [Vicinamibacterales bacterium]